MATTSPGYCGYDSRSTTENFFKFERPIRKSPSSQALANNRFVKVDVGSNSAQSFDVTSFQLPVHENDLHSAALHCKNFLRMSLRIWDQWRLRATIGNLQSKLTGLAVIQLVFLDQSALAVQRFWRGCVGRRQALERKAELEYLDFIDPYVRKIQRLFRGYQGRNEYRFEKMVVEHQKRRGAAALKIQCAWRTYAARERVLFERTVQWHAECRRIAAVKIQRAWGAYQAENKRFLEVIVDGFSKLRKVAAEEIQRVWKGHRVRTVLQEQQNDLVLAWRWDGPSQQVGKKTYMNVLHQSNLVST